MASFALTLLTCSFGLAAGISQKFLGSDGLPSFDGFVEMHKRDLVAGSAEYAHRKGVYEQRIKEIRRHNAKPNRLWTAGVNHLSDQTKEEFQQRLGWRHHERAELRSSASFGASMLELGKTQPFQDQDTTDYMNLSVAGVVPDQGGCGSCWAVATSELLKAHYELKNGKQRTFSPQELVSCVKNPKKCGGAGGCDGATVELALDYVMNNGLSTSEDTPYHGTTGTCGKDSTVDSKLGELDDDGRLLFTTGNQGHSDTVMVQSHGHGRGGQSVGLTGFATLEKNKYEPLVKALVEHGPVGITVAASDWSSYSEGVFDKCDDATLNHAVLLMGIGKEGEHKTYIVKNSWGSGWGEKGYIRLLRTNNEDTNCATDHSPKDGVACAKADGSFVSSVVACGTCGILYDNVIPSFTTEQKHDVF